VKRTGAQALVDALVAEGVELVFGILGHGNVQLGEALAEACSRIRFVPAKHEQGAVHAALGWTRMTGKPAAVTASVGPGATNLVTGAACARVNRWPLLLLPGEVFADGSGPLLQQIESDHATTANDCLRPVSKYWTRVQRPEQLKRVVREAFDAMLEPGNEGPATLCLPMDVQAEAMDLPPHWPPPRVRAPLRSAADPEAVFQAAQWIDQAERPLLIAGGGALRSGAMAEVRALAEALDAPVAQTQAGKGALAWTHPLNVFALGPTGTRAGNALAAKADVVVAIGTRLTDFATASETAFAPDARFINVNRSWFDVGKERAWPLWGDAKATLASLRGALPKSAAPGRRQPWRATVDAARAAWLVEADGWRNRPGTPLRQSRAIAVVNDFASARSVVISAAGSLPGDLQRLWRDLADDGLGYVCEYGFSTMGFEVAAGLGARLACPDREAIVLVGDMSFLLSAQELVTAVEQQVAYTVIVFANRGGQSIRGLQRGRGFQDFGMALAAPVDFVQLAQGMGCRGLRAATAEELKGALDFARGERLRPTVIEVAVDPDDRIGDTGGWWDVPVPAVDASGAPRPDRAAYLAAKAKQVLR